MQMQTNKHRLLRTRYALPALLIVALSFAAVPATSVVLTSLDAKGPAVPANEDQTHDDKEYSDYDDEYVTTINGTVTEFLYDDCYDYDDQSDDDDDWYSHNMSRVYAFVIDNSTIVEFGPWWYWMYMGINITDVVHIGDEVNVTGEMHGDEDGMPVLEAWHIENLTTGEELTVKEEGRPPWAGGPKELGISPWPHYDEDD